MVSFSYNDLPFGSGHRMRPSVGTGEGLPVSWAYDATDDKELVERWVEPAPVGPDEQPTKVVAREYFDDGTIKIWEEAGVFHYGDEYPPLAGMIAFLDFTTDADLDAGEIALTQADASRMVRQEARNYARLQHEGSSVVSFNPYLWPDDVVTFLSHYEDDRGFFSRNWRAVIEGVSHTYSPPSLVTALDYRCFLLEETRLPDPPITLPGVTAKVLRHGDLELMVRDDGRTVLIHQTASWAIDEGRTVLIVEPDVPIQVEGDDLVFNGTSAEIDGDDLVIYENAAIDGDDLVLYGMTPLVTDEGRTVLVNR
jgi:hypothetical protein